MESHTSSNLDQFRPSPVRAPHGEGLIDVLDRVLDKGVVIAGDIRINLLDIELLTIKIRLLISSADKAKEMGIDWWTRDPHLSSKSDDQQGKSKDAELENKELRERLERLEKQLKALTQHNGGGRAAGGQRLPEPAGAGTSRRGG
jgi:hypothetical protein